MEGPGAALYAYSFSPIRPAPGADHDVASYLSGLWDRCRRLGMTAPIFSDRPSAFPDLPTDGVPRYEILAGQGSREGEGLAQAIVFARHDTVGMVATLAATTGEDGPGEWADLYARWTAEVDSDEAPDGILGEAFVLVALGDPRAHGQPFPPNLAEAAAKGLSGIATGTAPLPAMIEPDAAMWDGLDARRRRVVGIIGSKDQEAALDRLVWWEGESELPALGRYLLNASKLDYEARVYQVLRPQFEEALQQVDRPLARVLAENDRLHGSRSVRLDDLLEAQADLFGAQQDSTGLVHVVSRLQELRRTVEIAGENMAMSAPPTRPAPGEGAVSMFERDRRTAGWLVGQIDHDLGYTDAVLTRAQGARELTSLRLQQAQDRHARLQNRVTLLQTAIWAALLTAIGAVATLGLTFDPAPRLRVPLLALWVALALAFPLLAAHWHERYRAADYAAAAAVGGSAAWLSLRLEWEGAPWPVTVVVVAAGGGLGWWLARAHDRVRADGGG
jgi:CASPASE and TPR Repeat-associated protein